MEEGQDRVMDSVTRAIERLNEDIDGQSDRDGPGQDQDRTGAGPGTQNPGVELGGPQVAVTRPGYPTTPSRAPPRVESEGEGDNSDGPYDEDDGQGEGDNIDVPCDEDDGGLRMRIEPPVGEGDDEILVFLDTFRRTCRCLLCPRQNSVRRTHDVASHLEWAHRKSTAEANRIVAALDRTNKTEEGQQLEINRVGYGIGLGNGGEENEVERQERLCQGELPDGAPIGEMVLPEKPGRAPIGEKAVCPFCKTEFTRKVSVLRHMKRVHNLGPEMVKKQAAVIKTIQSECLQCGKWVSDSGMTKHRRHCRGKDIETVQETGEKANNVPKGFARGGKLFCPIYRDFVSRCIKSVNQYVNKGMKVLGWFEERNKEFKTDKLLYPLDTNQMMPALSSYLKRDEANDADRGVAIKAYKYICRVAVENFEARYGADTKFTLVEKNAWKNDVMMKMKEYDGDLKVVNKQLKQTTTKNAAAAVASKTNLTYNPDRLKQVARATLNLPELKEVKEDLLNLSNKEIKEKYDETYVKNALAIPALMTTGGKRPGTVANTTLGELRSAEELEDGSHDVLVHAHKTDEGGPSHLSFFWDGLYESCMRYAEIFKSDKEAEDLLFSTTPRGVDKKRPLNMNKAVTWVKKLLAKSVATEQELKTMTAKSFRKGFSNWGAAHPDPEVNRDTIEAQDHSEAVDKLNYHVTSGRRVNKVNKTIMAGVMADENIIVGSEEGTGSSGKQNPAKKKGRRDAVVASGTGQVAKKNGRFTQSQRDVLLIALGKSRQDGTIRPPTGVTNKAVEIAKKCPAFRELYNYLLESTGKTQSAVNKIIWTSIRVKKKATTKVVSPESPMSDDSDDSEDTLKKGPNKDATPVSTDDSDGSEDEEGSDKESTDDSEYDYDVGRKKKRVRMVPVWKTAKKMKTPGWYKE